MFVRSTTVPLKSGEGKTKVCGWTIDSKPLDLESGALPIALNGPATRTDVNPTDMGQSLRIK